MTAFDCSVPRASHTATTPDDGDVEQLRNRIAELTTAVEARDTFIAIAAHELRNPMAPIIGQVDSFWLLSGPAATHWSRSTKGWSASSRPRATT